MIKKIEALKVNKICKLRGKWGFLVLNMHAVYGADMNVNMTP